MVSLFNKHAPYFSQLSLQVSHCYKVAYEVDSSCIKIALKIHQFYLVFVVQML